MMVFGAGGVTGVLGLAMCGLGVVASFEGAMCGLGVVSSFEGGRRA